MPGRRPLACPAADRQQELKTLVERVSAWLASGIEPHAIGVEHGIVPAAAARQVAAVTSAQTTLPAQPFSA
jgi:hypothetical protein